MSDLDALVAELRDMSENMYGLTSYGRTVLARAADALASAARVQRAELKP